jgi:hypothetical protein
MSSGLFAFLSDRADIAVQTDFRYFSVVFGVAEREVKGPDPQIHPNLLDCGDRPFKKSILKFGTI